MPDRGADRGDTEPSTDGGLPAAAIIAEHRLALVNRALARQLLCHDAVLGFSPVNEQRASARPVDGPRTLIVRRLLERSAAFLDCPQS